MGQPTLDKLIAIADAFDRGVFAGTTRVSTDEIASTVGLPSARVSRLLSSGKLGFKQVAKRRNAKLLGDRTYTYPPRIKLPNVSGSRTNPNLRHIVEAIASHEIPRQMSVTQLNTRLSIRLIESRTGLRIPDSLHNALLKAGFTFSRPGKKVVTYPAQWEQPALWPDLFARQRTLRRAGMKVSAIYRITDAAARHGGIIDEAMRRLDLSRVPYDARGALKRQVHGVIKEAYRAWERELGASLAADREAVQHPVRTGVDWKAVAALPDPQKLTFITIAARMFASARIEEEPGVYALRWVMENLLSAGASAE